MDWRFGCLCREEAGEPLGHNWVDATCTESEMCSRCNETRGEVLGHDTRIGYCSKCKEYITELLSIYKRFDGYYSSILDLMDESITALEGDATTAKVVKSNDLNYKLRDEYDKAIDVCGKSMQNNCF